MSNRNEQVNRIPCKGTGCTKGFRHSKETKEKISKANFGKIFSVEHRAKLSLAKKGKKIPRVWSEESREKLRKFHLGRKHTKEALEKMSQGHKGLFTKEKHPNWIKDRTMLSVKDDRGYYGTDTASREWSRNVKKRDMWKCQMANNDCNGRMESHHILNWKDYPELRYELRNGITLCHYHHPKSRKEEEKLSPYLQSLIKQTICQ